MKLTEDQIKQLHYHINAKQIPYTEVRDEVLDHYQTALEAEKEKTMEEVFKSLDQTFTLGYCNQASENYLNSLKSEYPKQFKKNFFNLFQKEKVWVPILLLAFVLSLPSWIQNANMLFHLVNLSLLTGLMLENWIISRSYPNKKIKHHYRSIDDKPTFAQLRAAAPKGFGILHVAVMLLIFLPIGALYIIEAVEDSTSYFFFQPPFLYATTVCLWLFFLMTIARYQARKAMVKPKVN
jgi:hypothetical protein